MINFSPIILPNVGLSGYFLDLRSFFNRLFYCFLQVEMAKLQGQLHYDIEHSIETVRQMQNAGPHLTRIHDLLRSSMFLKQQLDYEKNRQKSAMGRIDSQDSIVQELRKSKSLGILRAGRGAESTTIVGIQIKLKFEFKQNEIFK